MNHTYAIKKIKEIEKIREYSSLLVVFFRSVKILSTIDQIEKFNQETKEITDWVLKHCKFTYSYLYYNNRTLWHDKADPVDFADIYDRQYFVFSDIQDAMLFKLTWGGELVFNGQKEID